MTREPGPRAASRTWFCLPVAVMGVAASLVLGYFTQTGEDTRIRAGLETQAARTVKDIEKRLDEGIRPISILAFFLQTQTVPSADRFAAMARKVAALGIPVGRLNWEPRVPANQREAFEAQARADGLADFRIAKLMPDGTFQPADIDTEYFPIRLGVTNGGFPDAYGFDVTSDRARRIIAQIQTARSK